MSLVTRYGTTQGSHRVELEFDQKQVVNNRARLYIDGEQVDKTNMFYGEKDLTARLENGDDVVLRVHSGMVGEATRVQIQRDGGSWEDLPEVS